jgi:hypothetical protein
MDANDDIGSQRPPQKHVSPLKALRFYVVSVWINQARVLKFSGVDTTLIHTGSLLLANTCMAIILTIYFLGDDSRVGNVYGATGGNEKEAGCE